MSVIEIALKSINGKDVPAVTSLQVAEHFGKEHRNVLADIRKILDTDEDGFGALNFQLSSYLSEQNKEMPMYIMSKDGFVLLVMGYTGTEAMGMKKAYIARFNEMEKALQANAPTSLPEALRAYANMLEENELIRRQRDEAIRTKAWISDRKTASAMATASVAVRKAAALENELGRGRDYKAVKGIPWFLEVFSNTPAAYSVAGHKLSELSRRMGYEILEVEDSRFGSVKAYHIDVIESFRLALRNDLNMLGKYRSRRSAKGFVVGGVK